MSTDVVRQCAALADETRWQVLRLVGERPRSASALAAELPVSRQAIAKHLQVLVAAALVERQRIGAEVRFAAVGAQLSQLARTLDAVGTGWTRRLEGLKSRAEADPLVGERSELHAG